MPNWRFFPPSATVFADESSAYFVPLASVDLGVLSPAHTGPVHFLRPRMFEDCVAARQEADGPYPEGWFAFRRDVLGRYRSVLPLSGEVTQETGDEFETAYNGNARARFLGGQISADDLLSYADLSGEWPNANWNDGKSAEALSGRPLRYLGELDTVNFCKTGTAGSVLLLDEADDVIIQVFHWG